MATEWFYARGDQKHGPVSSAELGQLARSGKLLRTDLIWKEGMSQWRPAGESAKLFEGVTIPEPSPTNVASPPTESATAAFGDKAKAAAKWLGEKAKSAAQAAAAQAEIARLTQIALPSAYAAVGRHVIQSADIRKAFSDAVAVIDTLLAKLESLKTGAANRQPSTFAEKAKAVALATKELAESKAHELRLGQAYADLGRSVFEAGSFELPAELAGPIKDGLAKVDTLRKTAQTSVTQERRPWITKRRLMVGGGLLATVLCLSMLSAVRPTGGFTAVDLAKWRGTQEKDVPKEYLSGPNGEIVEDLYEVYPKDNILTLLRGYVSGQQVTPEKAIWQGVRQPELEAAKKAGQFIVHGQRIVWNTNDAPPVPDRRAQAAALAAGKPYPQPPVLPQKRRTVDFWLVGKCEGPRIDYYPDGSVLGGTYKQGKKEGTWTGYFTNGKKKIEQEWSQGKPNGRFLGWYDDGKQYSEGIMVDGKRDGLWTWWYRNGTKRSEQPRQKGVKDGVWKSWHENGQLWGESHFTNGVEVGESVVFWESGQKHIRLLYRQGRIQEAEGWNEDGSKITRSKTEPLPQDIFAVSEPAEDAGDTTDSFSQLGHNKGVALAEAQIRVLKHMLREAPQVAHKHYHETTLPMKAQMAQELKEMASERNQAQVEFLTGQISGFTETMAEMDERMQK